MSRFNAGDVLLVPFPFAREETGAKVRPALVIALAHNGDPVCCPIRSKPRAGSRCVPIGIDDFISGGLDLFSESHVQTDTVLTIRPGTVVALKGRVNREFLLSLPISGTSEIATDI